MKNTITEIKTVLQEINNRLDKEYEISNLEDKVPEKTQWEQQE